MCSVRTSAADLSRHRRQVWQDTSDLKARYEADGEAAFEPRSRRPKTSPTAIPAATVTLITELREELTTAGLDAGPDTIAWHLAHHHGTTISASTISRYLTRAGLVTPAPHQAAQVLLPAVRGHPAQPDLAGRLHPRPPHPARRHTRIRHRVLTWLEDCSRYALTVTAHARVTGPIVLAAFGTAATGHGTQHPP